MGTKVEGYIKENFIFDNSNNLERDQSLLDTGIIDSTGVLSLIMFLEETFEVSIDDEELVPANLDSIDKIAVFMEKKIS
ncbi:MAG: acyl carrier protein [Aliifodinibius sp.]|nr:acyl carrier protein [candidate division Zixibacteria bacterium]NIT60953.1 acyl carrier protein [Fodinibius sp.]NIW40066.1 acyl carrier protein [candidate division Zixibacteria bacterium]NIX58931.1 acyl carrier protein [candidate division Zixibacteria bacterium]NIY29534.1 acyl carrier protein [Fodinibius sp.]